MKKKWILRIILLLAYCIPFAYIAVNGDATSGTMLFYGLTVIGLAILCWGALRTNNVPIIYIGNALSFVSSYMAAKIMDLEPMGYYFKPFTSHSLIITITIVMVICQTVPVLIFIKRKKNK